MQRRGFLSRLVTGTAVTLGVSAVTGTVLANNRNPETTGKTKAIASVDLWFNANDNTRKILVSLHNEIEDRYVSDSLLIENGRALYPHGGMRQSKELQLLIATRQRIIDEYHENMSIALKEALVSFSVPEYLHCNRYDCRHGNYQAIVNNTAGAGISHGSGILINGYDYNTHAEYQENMRTERNHSVSIHTRFGIDRCRMNRYADMSVPHKNSWSGMTFHGDSRAVFVMESQATILTAPEILQTLSRLPGVVDVDLRLVYDTEHRMSAHRS